MRLDYKKYFREFCMNYAFYLRLFPPRQPIYINKTDFEIHFCKNKILDEKYEKKHLTRYVTQDKN